MPERAGPHPLAILLPGCLSWHPHHDTWRDDLLGRGYAVLHADSFSQRGLIGRAMLECEVCSGFKLQGDLRAGDLVAVLGSLHARDNLDLAQTVIFGWSHGGWTAMEFLMRLAAVQPQRGARARRRQFQRPRFFTILTAVQGSRSGAGGYPQDTRTLLFHGTGDIITNPGQCRARASVGEVGRCDRIRPAERCPALVRQSRRAHGLRCWCHGACQGRHGRGVGPLAGRSAQ